MTTVLPFANNNIQVYAYESFDFTISNVIPLGTLQPVSNTGGLNPTSLYFTKTGDTSVRFNVSGTLNNLTPGTSETFTLTAIDSSTGAVLRTSSNTVSIGAGRLLDASGVTLSNTSYTLFKGESVSQTLGKPLRLVAPSFALKTPTSIPALPPGLTFVRVDSNIFDISGTPIVVVPNSNYQIIGVQSNGSKVATTRINMVISNERLRTNLSGSSIIGGMQVGTAITPSVLTTIPPASSSNVRYTFPAFPDGIVVKDISGITQSSPFFPTDLSYTLVITGAPTVAAAQSFRTLDPTGSGVTYNVQASVGLLSNTQGFTFSFGETVLFDTPPILSNNFVGIPVDPSLNFFRAQTYFTTNIPITDISSSSLPAGMVLTFPSGIGRAALSGTPTVADTSSYTFKATNFNGISAELIQPITILNDSVTFSSPTDLCYNFILSRSLTQDKIGYYPANIQFIATAASGRAVSFSAAALAGTGLSLSNGFLVGTPTTVTSLTNLNVVATVSGSPATATKTIPFAIVNDDIQIADVSASKFTFIQNIPITPFQIPITSTLSGRNVIGYSQVGFPSGITIGPGGVVSGTATVGTPSSGTVSITATTGYASGSRDFSYNLTPDAILFTVPQATYTYEAGDPVIIPVTGTSYSGKTVSNYTMTLPSTYGLSIEPTSGLISGQWTTGVPPQQLLPSDLSFNITAQAGVVGSFPVSFTASPQLERVSFVWSSNYLYAYNESNWTALDLQIPVPTPVARYDFNNYTLFSPTIASSVGTVGPATIYRGSDNTFVTSNPANKYLNIYAPNNFPGQTGGIEVPTISNITAIEFWVRYTSLGVFSQYVLDARTGSPNGFWITGTASTDTIGSDYNGGTVYFNGSNVTINPGAGTPDIGATLVANGGWVQVVIVPPAPITDDISMFMRFSRQQGMPVSVADIAFYQTPLTKVHVQTLYNSKRARYGLSAISLSLANGFDTVIRNSNVDGNFIIATSSNYILRSTYKNGFVGNEVGNTTNKQICSSLAFKAPADWWCSGTADYSGVQRANVLYSDDGGISWGALSTLPTMSRDSNSPTGSSNPYLSAGIALKYKSGVLMAGGIYNNAGGQVMARSTDDGVSWAPVSGEFARECAYLNLDASSVWVATGSDAYKSIAPAWTTSTNTIKYSTDQGLSWSNALSGAFTMFGYELIYANNTWVATGVDGGGTYTVRMKYSTDGSNWSNVTLPNPASFTGILTPVPIAPLQLGSMNYDGSKWNVFAQRETTPGTWVSEIYSSPTITSSSWTTSNVTSSFSLVPNNSTRRFVTYTRPQYLRPTASKIITIVLSFASSLTTGPIITSPNTDSFILYQYIPTSIQLASSGSDVYFFITTADLPAGMSFDPTTNIISGRPAQIGNYSTTIYAKDVDGVTIQTLKFTVIVPRIIRKQDGAAAYTSLLRQYTEVLGAQNARDNRVLPNQEQSLGAFMSPEAPDVVTSAFTTTKCSVCARAECAASNQIVEGGNVQTVTCSLLDGNVVGSVFVDGGNAGVNICD